MKNTVDSRLNPARMIPGRRYASINLTPLSSQTEIQTTLGDVPRDTNATMAPAPLATAIRSSNSVPTLRRSLERSKAQRTGEKMDMRWEKPANREETPAMRDHEEKPAMRGEKPAMRDREETPTMREERPAMRDREETPVMEKDQFRRQIHIDAEPEVLRKEAPKWIDSSMEEMHETSTVRKLQTIACHPAIVACCVGLIIVGFLWAFRPSFVMQLPSEGKMHEAKPDWRWIVGIGLVGGLLTLSYPSISEYLKKMTVVRADA